MYTKIRYRGLLRHPADVERLIGEVGDICESNSWQYNIWQEDWSKPNTLKMNFVDGAIHCEGHAPLKGVSFSTRPGDETIWLTFTPDGMLNSLFTLNNPTFTANDKDYPWSRVKIRLDDPKTFAAVCNLFRFVADKYFADFQIMEETGYWEHGNLARLEKYLEQRTLREHQLEDELAAVQSDETLDPAKKEEIIWDLMRQFGKREQMDE